eukprot:scaffold405_cov243-Pinguiococcus_pyrenoidosus.AAC.4
MRFRSGTRGGELRRCSGDHARGPFETSSAPECGWRFSRGVFGRSSHRYHRFSASREVVNAKLSQSGPHLVAHAGSQVKAKPWVVNDIDIPPLDERSYRAIGLSNGASFSV